MGVRQVIVDDLTGRELPDNTEPTTVKVGSETFKPYLSDDSLARLVSMLSGTKPLLNGTTAAPKSGARSAVNDDTKAARHWALDTGYQYKGKPIGAKGRVPAEVVEAWKSAGSPGIGV